MSVLGAVAALALVALLVTGELRRVVRDEVTAPAGATATVPLVALAAASALLLLPRFLELVS